MTIKVVYNEKQVAHSGSKISPSAIKPKLMAELLLKHPELNLEFVDPVALSINDIKLCHEPSFVDDVMSLKRSNGFGTISESVVESLPWTNGAMYKAAKLAIEERKPTAALVSGFHHAGYKGFEGLGYFCTFNGLMITAIKLINEGCKHIAIVDCDMHDGNGTDDVLRQQHLAPYADRCININFGRLFSRPNQAQNYLDYFDNVKQMLMASKPDVIIYEAGADVHINDPFGGILTEEQMYERDIKMFTIAKELNIPIAWCLAGGYQVIDGKCDFVLQLHLNTFKACQQIYDY
jgi:acetoin utilization deacetylase AcuC-like enzyme